MPLSVVFDLDGTVVDTAIDLIETLNVVFAREHLASVVVAVHVADFVSKPRKAKRRGRLLTQF